MPHADPQTLAHLLTWLGLAIGTLAYYLLISRRAEERRQQALDEEAVLRSMVRHFASD
jgi:cytochrome oxidase assembly protein ShyY1